MAVTPRLTVMPSGLFEFVILSQYIHIKSCIYVYMSFGPSYVHICIYTHVYVHINVRCEGVVGGREKRSSGVSPVRLRVAATVASAAAAAAVATVCSLHRR